jgi:hypothetical protein
VVVTGLVAVDDGTRLVEFVLPSVFLGDTAAICAPERRGLAAISSAKALTSTARFSTRT